MITPEGGAAAGSIRNRQERTFLHGGYILIMALYIFQYGKAW